MSKIVQLADYRARRPRLCPGPELHEVWVCGNCGAPQWTLFADGVVRCMSCHTRAGNVHVVEADEEPRH